MLLLSLFLALFPSLAWLVVFLHEDVHPEPNRLVIRSFIAGMIATIPTLFVEQVMDCFINSCPDILNPGTPGMFSSSPLAALSDTVRTLLFLFFGIALVEETMKYLAAKAAVLKSPNFDEPIDALLYLVIAGLGFAAVENAFTVGSPTVQASGFFGSEGVFFILGARFLSATLLHALASGIVGYALARSYFSAKPHHVFIAIGLIVAGLVHASYNGLISGMLPGSDSQHATLNVLLLLTLTGMGLTVMIRDLRSRGIAHRWRNAGTEAKQIA